MSNGAFNLSATSIQEALAHHKAQPHVSLEQHVKRRHVELGQSLSDKTAIYLDTKFWVIARDVALGRRTSDLDTAFLRSLRTAVSAERAYCPISESSLIEILKQQDPASLHATAQLVDELSDGVCLTDPETRTATEICHLVHAKIGKSDLHPLHHLIWSKVSYALGIVHPQSPALDAPSQLMMQKGFFDHLWGLPFSSIASRMAGSPMPNSEGFQPLAALLNEEVPQHAHEIRSFQQAYTSEVRGSIDLYSCIAADVMCDLALKAVGDAPDHGSPEWRKLDNAWRHLLSAALEQVEGKKRLPSIHIHASLHAAVRWNKARRFKTNDFYDFHHAIAALGHCDLFFTERSLRQLVTDGNLALDVFHRCPVAADVDEALKLLNSAMP